jgi:DNA-binding winged helix-turn-helix (wHTH) protein
VCRRSIHRRSPADQILSTANLLILNGLSIETLRWSDLPPTGDLNPGTCFAKLAFLLEGSGSGSHWSHRVLRFGPFTVDLEARSAYKETRRLKLQDQPFQVLAFLLERPGELITREELRQRLWAADTLVDFDHGLNIAINKVREALGDSADEPRFIQTVPRRGYRFLGELQSEKPPTEAGAGQDAATAPHFRALAGAGLGGCQVVGREFVPARAWEVKPIAKSSS